MSIKDYISDRVFDGLRPLSKNQTDRLRKKLMSKDCGCGRSPTGKCIGWHNLTNEKYEEKKKLLTESTEKKLLQE